MLPFPIALFASAYSPAMAPNALAWWSAADINQSDASAISSWTDRIGGASAAQSSAGLKPIYRTSTVNSLPGVDFNGDRILTNTSLASYFNAAAPNLTIYAVASSFSIANGALAMILGVTKASTGLADWINCFEFLGQTGGTQVRLDCGISGNSGTKQCFPLLGNQTYQNANHVYTFKMSTSGTVATGVVYVDGTQIATASTPSGFTGATTIDTIGIGGWMVGNTAGRMFPGKVCDLFIANAAHGTTDRQNVENYFKTKYAI